MSLEIAGVWNTGVWGTTVYADGFWREGEITLTGFLIGSILISHALAFNLDINNGE